MKAHDIGLIDRIVEGDLQQHAVAYAEEVKDIRPLPKSSERQDKIDGTDAQIFADFRKANGRKFRGFELPKPTSRRSRRPSPSPTPRASSTSANCSWSR